MSLTRMETSQVEDLLSIFNVSGTGSLSKQEFVFCWNEWIKKASMTDDMIIMVQMMMQVARPSTAFIVVDVQNDFISGSLAITNCPAGQNGEDVSRKNYKIDLQMRHKISIKAGVHFVASLKQRI